MSTTTTIHYETYDTRVTCACNARVSDEHSLATTSVAAEVTCRACRRTRAWRREDTRIALLHLGERCQGSPRGRA